MDRCGYVFRLGIGMKLCLARPHLRSTAYTTHLDSEKKCWDVSALCFLPRCCGFFKSTAFLLTIDRLRVVQAIAELIRTFIGEEKFRLLRSGHGTFENLGAL